MLRCRNTSRANDCRLFTTNSRDWEQLVFGPSNGLAYVRSQSGPLSAPPTLGPSLSKLPSRRLPPANHNHEPPNPRQHCPPQAGRYRDAGGVTTAAATPPFAPPAGAPRAACSPPRPPRPRPPRPAIPLPSSPHLGRGLNPLFLGLLDPACPLTVAPPTPPAASPAAASAAAAASMAAARLAFISASSTKSCPDRNFPSASVASLTAASRSRRPCSGVARPGLLNMRPSGKRRRKSWTSMTERPVSSSLNLFVMPPMSFATLHARSRT